MPDQFNKMTLYPVQFRDAAREMIKAFIDLQKKQLGLKTFGASRLRNAIAARLSEAHSNFDEAQFDRTLSRQGLQHWLNGSNATDGKFSYIADFVRILANGELEEKAKVVLAPARDDTVATSLRNMMEALAHKGTASFGLEAGEALLFASQASREDTHRCIIKIAHVLNGLLCTHVVMLPGDHSSFGSECDEIQWCALNARVMRAYFVPMEFDDSTDNHRAKGTVYLLEVHEDTKAANIEDHGELLSFESAGTSLIIRSTPSSFQSAFDTNLRGRNNRFEVTLVPEDSAHLKAIYEACTRGLVE